MTAASSSITTGTISGLPNAGTIPGNLIVGTPPSCQAPYSITPTLPNTGPNWNGWGITGPNILTHTVSHPSGDSLIRGGDVSRADVLYPDSFQTATYALAFHFSVWEAIHREHASDYAFVSPGLERNDLLSSLDTRQLLVFGSRKTRAAFRRWHKSYTGRFIHSDYQQQCVPTLAAGRVRGYVVPYEMPGLDSNLFASAMGQNAHRSPVPAEQRDVWAWIVAHGRRGAYRIPGAWVFVNDVDAVAFKLKWI